MKQSSKPAHLELEPIELKKNWQQGFYSPPGYLYHLFLAMKRVGWWIRIDNVSRFCQEWEINRRTFYRAKAKLIDLGLLEEDIVGPINIRLTSKPLAECDSSDTPVTNLSQPKCDSSDTPVTPVAPTVSDLSPTVTAETQAVSDVTQSTVETVANKGLHGSPRSSSDLFSDLSLKEASEREKSEVDPEFRAWLNRKASQLPNPPVLREQWIAKQAQLASNQHEFRLEQQRQKGSAGSPPEQFQLEFSCLPALQVGDRTFVLHKLSALLQQGWEDQVRTLLDTHPDWGFELQQGRLSDREA
jgi:hypothetical protein